MTTRTQILSFIEIPTFSDDIRGIVLDYMHSNCSADIVIGAITYKLSLRPGLEDNKLCLQVVVHGSTYSRVMSSFGPECEEKAIQEYTNRKNNTGYTSYYVNDLIFNELPSEKTSYGRLYAFCPEDLSTIMIEIVPRNAHPWGWVLRLYSMKEIQACSMPMSLRTDIKWVSFLEYIAPPHYESFDVMRKNLLAYQQVASKRGISKSYDQLNLRNTEETFINDSLWSPLPSMKKT